MQSCYNSMHLLLRNALLPQMIYSECIFESPVDWSGMARVAVYSYRKAWPPGVLQAGCSGKCRTMASSQKIHWHSGSDCYNDRTRAGRKTLVHRHGVGIPRFFLFIERCKNGLKSAKLLYRWSGRLWRLWLSLSILHSICCFAWSIWIHKETGWWIRIIPIKHGVRESCSSYRTAHSSWRRLWISVNGR